VWKEEIFGPVLCVRQFTTEEEAVAVANDTIYGLAAAVMSADAARCERVTQNLRCGIVWTNCCQPAFIQAPWGGVKKSGELCLRLESRRSLTPFADAQVSVASSDAGALRSSPV